MYRQSKPKGSSLWWCSSLFGLRYIFIYLYCYSWLYVFIKNFAYFLAKVWYEYHFLFLCSTGNKYSSLKGKIFYFISPTIRASPAVCHILLGIFCVLATSKKICQIKKRAYLQQFGIIHLPNSDLTYIRNPERNKIIFMLFHLLKT